MVTVMLYSCMFCVALSLNVFVLCVACLTMIYLMKQFAYCLGVIVILLLNVMVLFSVVGGALWDIPCMVFQSVCVVPVIIVCVEVLLPYVLFVFLYVGSYLLI